MKSFGFLLGILALAGVAMVLLFGHWDHAPKPASQNQIAGNPIAAPATDAVRRRPTPAPAAPRSISTPAAVLRGVITGVVVDAAGKPLPGIRVAGREVISDRSGDQPVSGLGVGARAQFIPSATQSTPFTRGEMTTTTLDGSFVFEHLAAGPCNFNARRGVQWKTLREELTTTFTKLVEIKFAAEASLRGVVIGREGLPVGGARIKTVAYYNEGSNYGSTIGEHTRDAPRRTTTGVDGRFSIPDLAVNQKFELLAEADGYAPKVTEPLAVDRDNRIELGAGGAISGRVLMGDSAIPAGGVSLRLDDARYVTMRAESNAAGEFRFANVPDGGYIIGGRRATADPLVVRPASNLQLKDGQSRTLDLRADAPVTIGGTVRDPKKGAIAAARVKIARIKLEDSKFVSVAEKAPEYGLAGTAETDSNGNYTIGFITPGELSGRAEKYGYTDHYVSPERERMEDGEEFVPSAKAFSGKPGQRVEHVDFVLLDAAEDPSEQMATASGRVIGPDKQPIAGIRVHAYVYSSERGFNPGYIQTGKSTLTDVLGRFTVTDKRGILKGVIVLPTREFPYSGSAANAGEILVEARRCGRVSGLVTDTSGRPIEGADVQVANGTQSFPPVQESNKFHRTDAKGSFSIDLLPPTAYRVYASKLNYRARTNESSQAFELKEDEVKDDVVLMLDPTEMFKGRLVDASKRSMREWRANIQASPFDDDGNFSYRISEVDRMIRFDHYGPSAGGMRAHKGYVTGSIDYPRKKPAEFTEWRIPPTGSMSGKFVYADDGSPAGHLSGHIRFAGNAPPSTIGFGEWQLAHYSVTDPDLTREDGTFRIDDLAPGSYLLEVQGAAIVSKNIPDLIVQSDRNTETGLIRVERGIQARGRLVDAITRQPIHGPSYHISIESRVVTDQGTLIASRPDSADAEGRFVVNSIPTTLRHLTFKLWIKTKDLAHKPSDRYEGSVDVSPHKAGEAIDLGDVPLAVISEIKRD